MLSCKAIWTMGLIQTRVAASVHITPDSSQACRLSSPRSAISNLHHPLRPLLSECGQIRLNRTSSSPGFSSLVLKILMVKNNLDPGESFAELFPVVFCPCLL